jgi:serine/threonine protein kinase
VTEIGIGSILGGYRIEELIGHGGMGVVYRATQLRLSRTVAVKVITPALAGDADFRARFESESRIAASIDHNHVVPIYEADEVDGLLFIAMRYVEGQDLRSLVESEGPLPPERAARIIAQVGSALDAAHRRGLVHRDVKPGNVLISGSGEDEHAYLTDFGLTKKLSDAGMTKTGQWVGTLDYAAPEQINGQGVDARTDVYALGAVLYHALTGQVPYVRDSDVAKMYAHLHDPAPAVTAVKPDVPEGMASAVTRSMAKNPADRYPSAGDFSRAVQAGADGSIKAGPERSVAVGEAAPAGATRVSAEPPPAQPTAVTPPPAEPTRASEPPRVEPPPPAPTPPARQAPPPVFAQAPAPQATPATNQQFFAGPPQPPPTSAGGSSPGANRGLLFAIAGLLVVVVAGGAAFAAGVFDSKEPRTSSVAAADDPTAEATPDSTVEPTPTATKGVEVTATPVIAPPGNGPCENRFISPSERAELSAAQGTNEPAVDGSVFYGVCAGNKWAIASFPDGSDGVFRRVKNLYWYNLGSIRGFHCQVPNLLLAMWKQPICVQGE